MAFSEFKCKHCGSDFMAAFREIQPGLPLSCCVACGSREIEYVGTAEDILKKEAQDIQAQALKAEPDKSFLRGAFSVGDEVLIRSGNDWYSRTITKITAYRGINNPVLCPHCAMPLLGEARIWTAHYGNLPLKDVMSKYDIDPYRLPPNTRIASGPTNL